MAVARECCLSNGRGAFGMRQYGDAGQCWIGRVQFPQKYFATLDAQCHVLTVKVQGESNEPNFAIFVLEAMQYRCGRIAVLDDIVVVQSTRFPAYN